MFQQYLSRYQRMDYPAIVSAVDAFMETLGVTNKEVLGGGLRHVYPVAGQLLAVSFWYKTSYTVITNESNGAILYSLYDPETDWVLGCFEELLTPVEDVLIEQVT